MSTEEGHFSKEEILDYLNINMDFDKMVDIEMHLDNCRQCKTLSKELESSSNKQQRDKEFDEATEERRVAALKAKKTINSNVIRYLILIIILSSIIGFGYYNNDYLLSILTPKESSVTEEINDSLPVDEELSQLETTSFTHFESDSTSIETLSVVESINNEEIDASILVEQEQPITTTNAVVNQTRQETVSPQVKNTISTQIHAIETSNVEQKTPEVVAEEIKESVEEQPISVSKGTLVAIPNSENQATPTQGYQSFNAYVENNFIYPESAKSNSVEGNVIIEFIIAEEGSPTDIKIVSGLGYGCDEVVINLISNSPAWKTYIGEDFVENKRAEVRFIFKL